MTLGGLLLLLLVLAMPVCWFVSEFVGEKPIRIALGVLAILCSFGVATIVGKLSELNYNAWYGSASKQLIDTTVHQIEDGNLSRVMTTLRALNRQYQPTYENRADYLTLTEKATKRMRGEVDITSDSAWNATIFEHSTWLGHWEDDSGYWIVINDVGQPYDIVRSGHPGKIMKGVTVSEDFRSLEYFQGSNWKHTVTLVNKYEAKHVWFDLEKNSVWKTEHLHKLVRATPDQKRATQQPELVLDKTTDQTAS